MNNMRREGLQEVIEMIEMIEEAEMCLEMLRDEEEEYKDNMPENLYGSQRYERAEEALDHIETAIESLNDAKYDIIMAKE